MPFKIYEVEFKRTSYVKYVVEALDENAAEEVALDLLKKDGNEKADDEWELSNVWEAEI